MTQPKNHTRTRPRSQDPIENYKEIHSISDDPVENGIQLGNDLSHHTNNPIDQWSLDGVFASLKVHRDVHYYLFLSDEAYQIHEEFYIGHTSDDHCLVYRLAFKTLAAWHLARRSYLGKG
ncbi:MAG: hypothetical protein HC925_02290 [Coleofasciculaceae cyanobacterium SM2_3_26]|nr:hypothetical protein [Coleofasciculaceae cyanobacterium SM2_3_26]